METLKLAEIVLSVNPDLYQLLKTEELNQDIVLRNGLHSLKAHDLLEIVEASIAHNQNNALH
ncbi:hypothetical protein [Ammoniphilus resinae]|uniref:Uncharacterized protein n=1 Tax=Ammoniphilus resinae TaxID=861532 RepID=A0ABS4GTW2_9BACL|nr:hypothetical protein [Ammoniphilus resinae]MBP1933718.1 hypothetical protein [Ammoniphilus resinae]